MCQINARQHTTILTAYLSRLSLADLRSITAAAAECHQAQLNEGLSAQVSRQRDMREAIDQAVNGLVNHDRHLITLTITDVVRSAK
jgi:hypothetical protein